jgi:hypothetical protein
VRTIKSWWLILAFVSGFAFAMVAEDLLVKWRADRLELSAPNVHFLGGKPLALLRNAEAVPFDFQVTVFSGNREHVFARHFDEFVISFGLWEEKFRVVKTQSPRKIIDHLSATDAEQWCWKEMALDLTGLGNAEPFWMRVEIRAQDAKDGSLFGRGNISESGISLAGLIEAFSRPARLQQSHWGPFLAGPYTLDGLKRDESRQILRRGF